MGLEEIQSELHRYYDRLTSGICLIGMQPGEPILFVNKGMLKIYHCMDEAEFYRFTGRRFRGMVDSEDYYPVAHMSETDYSGPSASARGMTISAGPKVRPASFLWKMGPRHGCCSSSAVN
jgi:hypothetical protein